MNNNTNSSTNNINNLPNINQNTTNSLNNVAFNNGVNNPNILDNNSNNMINNSNVGGGVVNNQAVASNNQGNITNSKVNTPNNQTTNTNIVNTSLLNNNPVSNPNNVNQTIHNNNPLPNPNINTAVNTSNIKGQNVSNVNTENKTANPSNIKIEETSVTRSQKGTVTIATVNGGNVSILTDKMPAAIDLSVKEAKTITKNGKKVRIMTKRELITNIILSFFFVLVLCGAGYGVYYYLFGNNPRNFETKNISIEYGEEIPASVRNYINLTDISEPDYTLDTSAVKNEIGTYTYKVSYGSTTKTGTITINDTKAPVVTFNDVKEFPEGTTITKEMLVASCEDISSCTYDLTSPVDTNTPGTITASITAKDNLGNSKDYPIELNIIEKLTPLVCSSTIVTTDENSKTLLESNNYTLSFTNQKLLKTGNLKVIRTYLSDSDYTSIKDNLTSSGYTLEDINRRAIKESTIDNVANLTTQDEIKTHLESNSYTCSIKDNE